MTDIRFDKDGLLHSKHLEIRDQKLFLENREIFVKPEAKSVVQYFADHLFIWAGARISVNFSDI
ncbi:hypothetical protein ANAEL_02659 [Anaerolineales bacterium]|nr:hypothetical protein ANAEL_02659 [Anaerolineales bacterium]